MSQPVVKKDCEHGCYWIDENNFALCAQCKWLGVEAGVSPSVAPGISASMVPNSYTIRRNECKHEIGYWSNEISYAYCLFCGALGLLRDECQAMLFKVPPVYEFDVSEKEEGNKL